ncbi:uncharacterized protein LOC119344638, partial [Triticum dicoccoides]|uniref:uncharacterized protein LOC119344183 n=1 Tax=Triticum dicoccoides TaxID=85692 RepID=UPI00188E3F5A
MASSTYVIASIGWGMAALGWFVAPTLNLFVPKIPSWLSCDVSKKLRELEIHIMPELEKTLQAVDQERMIKRGDEMGRKSDVAALDKMAAMLRHAREDAEDILDDHQDIELYRFRFWRRLCLIVQNDIDRFNRSCLVIARIVRRGWVRVNWTIAPIIRRNAFIVSRKSEGVLHVAASAVATCITHFNKSFRSGSARLLRRARNISLLRQEDVLPRTTNTVAPSHETVPVITSSVASDGPVPLTTSVAASHGPVLAATNDVPSDEPVPHNSVGAASQESVPEPTNVAVSDELRVPVIARSNSESSSLAFNEGAVLDEQAVPVTASSDSIWWGLSCWCNSFNFFKNCCRSILYLTDHAIKAAHTYQGCSYDVVGITDYQENATALDSVLTVISRRNLKKKIEKVETIVSEVKKSSLLGAGSKSTLRDTANKNRSNIRTTSKRRVFGREAMREDIMAKLRETPPSSSTSPCYSVIGIYGIAGSGKTTFARYTRDYIEEECKEEGLFDTIMCIHMSETFSVDDIFHDMLKDITKDRHSNISDRE